MAEVMALHMDGKISYIYNNCFNLIILLIFSGGGYGYGCHGGYGHGCHGRHGCRRC